MKSTEPHPSRRLSAEFSNFQTLYKTRGLTLLRCLNLLEVPTSGRIVVDGSDLTALSATDLRAARRRIGTVFQHFELLRSRTVAENIALPLELGAWIRRP